MKPTHCISLYLLIFMRIYHSFAYLCCLVTEKPSQSVAIKCKRLFLCSFRFRFSLNLRISRNLQHKAKFEPIRKPVTILLYNVGPHTMPKAYWQQGITMHNTAFSGDSNQRIIKEQHSFPISLLNKDSRVSGGNGKMSIYFAHPCLSTNGKMAARRSRMNEQ